MNSLRTQILGFDGTPLECRAWMPEDPPRALVVLVHGVTEHLDRYGGLADALNAARIGAWGADLRGHGHSGGRRGHVDRWPDYLADLTRVVDRVQQGHPGVPLFLFGHSLGSLIATAWLLENSTRVRGLVLSGAALDPVGVARPHLVALAKACSFLWPTLAIPLQTAGKAVLSRDPTVEAAFLADPLVLRRVTARFGTEALAMIRTVKARARDLHGPLLMIHGGLDPLNTLAGARRFFEAVSSTDKELKVYPDNLHEPHQDLDRDRVLADLVAWISARV